MSNIVHGIGPHSLHPVEIPRGLTRRQAANVYGLSLSGFDKARREGKIPAPTLPGRRFDRRLLDASMDRLSGISSQGDAETPLMAWRASHARAVAGH